MRQPDLDALRPAFSTHKPRILILYVVLVLMILAYTAYAYWVFRGKVDPHEGYH